MHSKLLVLQSLLKRHSYALLRISSNHLRKRPSITNSREDFEEQKCKINILFFIIITVYVKRFVCWVKINQSLKKDNKRTVKSPKWFGFEFSFKNKVAILLVKY